MQSEKIRTSAHVRFGMAALVFAAGTLACVAPSLGAPKARQDEVKWQNSAVTRFAAMNSDQMRAAINAELKGEAQRRMVVQLDAIPTEEQRANLAQKGMTLGSFLGGTAFFATVTQAAAANLEPARGGAGIEGVRSVAAIPFGAKIQRDLMEERAYEWMTIDSGKKEGQIIDADRARDPIVAVNVLFHRDVDMIGEALFAVESVGGTVIDRVNAAQFMIVSLPMSSVKALASLDVVQWTEAPLPQFSETNANSGNRTGAYLAQAAPYNLDGAGVKVLVYDGGQIRTTHQSYGGRASILAGDNATLSDHATHVACTVGANSVVPAVSRGMAPGVSIISAGFQVPGGLTQGFLFNIPGDLVSDYSAAVANNGVEITTNSIGTNTSTNGYPCDWQGDYGTTSQIIDQLVRGTAGLSDGNPLRVVWANGNERQSTRCLDTVNPGVPSGYHLTAPPSCAKNHIAVGAVDGTTVNENMSTFSSWGPSDDGRMKPDISAPGVNTVSCGSGSDTASSSKSGTSMATPTTTGCLALLLQDFKVQYPSEPLPRNSMLKAFLAHTAVDKGNVGPDNQFGYGTIRIVPAIEQMRSGNWKAADVGNGGSASYLVIVPPGGTDPLKVTLAWDDFPSTPPVGGQGQGGLINDLDLVVTSPSNVRAYPWTLQGLSGNPAAPAVQTQENHVDNIEQVYVANPEPGAWLVEVRGTTVPEGPQPFSIVASPQFVGCSSTGVAGLDKSLYPCGATANLKVVDCDLNTSNSVIDTVTVNVASTSNPTGVNVVLTEVAAEAADFRGSIVLGSGISANDGDTVTLTYLDADSGGGSPATVTSSATVDCTPPTIAGVTVSAVGPRVATVTCTTNEPARGTLRIGTACGTFTQTFNSARGTTHTFNVSGLVPSTAFFFDLSAQDDAGNAGSDDNGGSCYTFNTAVVPDFFTELWTAGNDLDNTTYTWTPAANISAYTLCRAPSFALPVDPAGGTLLSLTDDSNTNVALTGGQTVKLYGVSYSSVFVGSNGYITFTAGDTDLSETFADHFDTPRVSMLFDDLNPTQAGQISYKQLPDRLTITYLNVTEHNSSNQNTFQVSLYFNGTIEVTYLNIAAVDGLAGLSGSTSLNPDFGASDLSGYPSCGPRPPFAGNMAFNTPLNLGVSMTLAGSDDGQPGGALVYTILSLPATALVEDLSNGSNILSVPYTLSSNQVRFKPQPGFTGSESFTYKVNDNGVAPDGGDSNIATVSVTVSGSSAAGLPFSDEFPTTSFDPANWSSFGNATIDTLGIAEPTEPNSARFNGSPTATGDVITSRTINLNSYTNLRLQYAFQVRGGGESPDAGDDLIIEYQNTGGTYTEMGRHLGSLPDGTTYTLVDVALPAAAKHGNFRLRIRALATAGAFDDWFVDNVSITGQSCPGDTNGDGLVNTVDLTNFLAGFGDIAEGPFGGDFDGNGVTDTLDLTTLLGFFGANCNTP